MRPGAPDEREVEDVFVVDGVEGAGREEGEVLAVEGERGCVVAEAQRGRLGHRQVGGVGRLSWRSGRGPGCDAASQVESGEKTSPETSPSSLRSTSRTSPVSRSTSGAHPSCEATAARLPSGAMASPRTRPSCPAASRRGVAGARDRSPGRTPARRHRPRPSDQHHVLLALHPEGAGQPGAHTGPGGERAGRSGAVGDPVDGAAHGDRAAAVRCGRGRRPRTSGRRSRGAAAGRRAVRRAAGRSRRGSAPSRSSRSHSSPADAYTTRAPSVAACRA